MGTIHHNFVIAVGYYNSERHNAAFERVKAEATRLGQRDVFPNDFSNLLVGPIEGITNGYVTYFMAPDGSKEWWETSEIGNEVRDFFIDVMTEAGCTVVHGGFGELLTTFTTADEHLTGE